MLLALTYLVESPLLHLIGPLIGASWIATIHLFLDCGVMTAAGFVCGRFGRPRSMLACTAFLVTLSFGNLGSLNVPWLLELSWNLFHDSRYLDAWAGVAEAHVLLLGSLFAGAALGRAREKPISLLATDEHKSGQRPSE